MSGIIHRSGQVLTRPRSFLTFAPVLAPASVARCGAVREKLRTDRDMLRLSVRSLADIIIIIIIIKNVLI